MNHPLPKTATVTLTNSFHNTEKAIIVKLIWETNSNMDGWFADLTPPLNRVTKKYGCSGGSCACGRDRLSVDIDGVEEQIDLVEGAVARININNHLSIES